jgi:gas vesicle protein GvpN
MARNSSRNRKVRGSKITSSRSDKRSERGVSTTGRSSSRDSSPAATDLDALAGRAAGDAPFVETDATESVKRRIDRWLRAGRPVHLIGPTGCGKTALAMQVARSRDRPVVLINGDAGLTTADLVGEYAEEERESVRDRYVHNVMKSKDVIRDRWVDNPLTVAVREGATLVYNEFSRTKPAANNVLLSVFEEGTLELPGKRGEDRYVDVHPEFRAVLTSNSSEYAGVHEPQDALLDRLVGVHMEFYDRETELAIVRAHVDGLAEDRSEHVVRLVRDLRERLDVTVATRAAIMTAEGLAVHGEDPDEELYVEVLTDVLASKVADREGVRRLRGIVTDAVDDHGAV